jgi:hypothetical protein
MQRQVLSLAKPALARATAGRAMFAAAPMRGAATASGSSGASSAGSALYQLVFRRNVTYITYIVGGALVLEAVYGKATDGFWNLMNNGVRAGCSCGGRHERTDAHAGC